MMLIAKKRKNIETQRKEQGRRYAPSNALLTLGDDIRAESIPLTSLATGIMNYYGDRVNSLWANRIADAFALDICNMSEEELELVKQNEELSLLHSDDFFDLLYEVGKCSVVYGVDPVKISPCIKIGARTYLTERPIGIGVSVDEFVLQYKGKGIGLSIPANKAESVYRALTRALWNGLRSIHERQDAQKARRKARKSPPVWDVELLVDLSESPQRLSSEMLASPDDPSDPMEMNVEDLTQLMDKVLSEIETASGLTSTPTDFDQVPFNPEGTEETSE